MCGDYTLPFAPSGLYAITDPKLMPGDLLGNKVEAALQGGCRLIQYRNKIANYARRLQDAQLLSELCRRHQATLMINDDLELALAIQADGVHLGPSDTDIAQARSKVPPAFIIGATCHNSLSLAAEAQTKGADYLAFGRFFPSQTKAYAPAANPGVLRAAKQQSSLPVVAIGGITEDNAQSLIDVGADCVAICFDVFKHSDVTHIRHKVERISALFKI